MRQTHYTTKSELWEDLILNLCAKFHTVNILFRKSSCVVCLYIAIHAFYQPFGNQFRELFEKRIENAKKIDYNIFIRTVNV